MDLFFFFTPLWFCVCLFPFLCGEKIAHLKKKNIIKKQRVKQKYQSSCFGSNGCGGWVSRYDDPEDGGGTADDGSDNDGRWCGSDKNRRVKLVLNPTTIPQKMVIKNCMKI
ncbi:hypothetical protein GLYMA_04G049600v4 [Glycine max]|uniref:Uncharacterized protein n=2 Tax=Glycine subgen. Soja TaxID=1462606 RepID=A0A0R0KAA0_SOYBN|nr:hypothetical protein JHK87_008964 [Glycine soja]KAG5048247.1 hypothetical protein JHK85_009350 [Glycine max]KAG5065365.1 hypothetical protein JHK86_009096 [Glycine max]KAH1109834.1 hypothetical protein GYH30_008970 [Glycine max]KAH1252585.1 hypothetical protein GmHk_04G009518 [Glycine max]